MTVIPLKYTQYSQYQILYTIISKEYKENNNIFDGTNKKMFDEWNKLFFDWFNYYFKQSKILYIQKISYFYDIKKINNKIRSQWANIWCKSIVLFAGNYDIQFSKMELMNLSTLVLYVYIVYF